jgi:hypothetical protein
MARINGTRPVSLASGLMVMNVLVCVSFTSTCRSGGSCGVVLANNMTLVLLLRLHWDARTGSMYGCAARTFKQERVTGGRLAAATEADRLFSSDLRCDRCAGWTRDKLI